MLNEAKLEEIYKERDNTDYKSFTLSNGENISTKVNVPLFKYIHDNLIKYGSNQAFGYFLERNIVKDDLIDLGVCQELLDITIDYGTVMHKYFKNRFNIEKEIKSLIKERACSRMWKHNTLDLDIGISLPINSIPYSLYIRYKDFAMFSEQVGGRVLDYTLLRNIYGRRNSLDYLQGRSSFTDRDLSYMKEILYLNR